MKREEKENILIAMGSEWLNNLCSKDRHCYLVEEDLDRKIMEEHQ